MGAAIKHNGRMLPHCTCASPCQQHGLSGGQADQGTSSCMVMARMALEPVLGGPLAPLLPLASRFCSHWKNCARCVRHTCTRAKLACFAQTS